MQCFTAWRLCRHACTIWVAGFIPKGYSLVTALLMFVLCGCTSWFTEYAPGYSESAFQGTKRGDTRAKVLSEVGAPLRIVGNDFYFIYCTRDLYFYVNSETGEARLALKSRKDPAQVAQFGHITTREQLERELEPPDQVIGTRAGQYRNPDVLSYIYTDENGPYWNVRVIFIHKERGTVVDKWAYVLED